MKKRFPAMLSLASLFLVMAVPVAVWASGGGGEGGEKVEMVPFMSSNFLWTVINFCLLVWLLTKFGKGPMKEGLAARKDRIEKAINDAAEAKALAEKALQGAERRLAEKDVEVQGLLDDAKRVAAREREQLDAQGKKVSQDIADRARLNIDVELKKAKDDLKAEAVRLAIEVAEKKIGAMITSDDQKRLVNQYIKGMESRN